MDQEIKEGRGCGPNKDHVMLDVTHIGKETIMKRLPSIFEIAKKFANVDASKEMIPVVPTIHYQMGGIPTNIYGQVVVPNDQNNGMSSGNKIVKGFYAVGECSCVSVHGANRLGTNSLLDLVVFGRAAGNHIVDSIKDFPVDHKQLSADAADKTLARLNRFQTTANGENAQDVADAIRATMQMHAAVFRKQETMDKGVVEIMKVAERVNNIQVKDTSKVFNTALVEALEVDNLIEVAKATMVSAAARHECRGAHTVVDYEKAPEVDPYMGRNDTEWLKHTLWYSEGNKLDYKPVTLKPLTVDTVPLKPRTF
jgi:succinate dehydrogenase / fumarate reductase flavoprotein subunit